MNKMLVAVFDREAAAFEGLSALKDLHREWRHQSLFIGGDRQRQAAERSNSSRRPTRVRSAPRSGC